MIPKKIQPYFNIISAKKDFENCLTEGILTCCNNHDFEVFVFGNIKYSMFSNVYLVPKNDTIVLEARCEKCGKTISVFDSRFDGYECCNKMQYEQIPLKPINCRKCHENSFSVNIEYEYSDIQEIISLREKDAYNAFTWIWVTLECNNCGSRYKRFIDYETA